MLQATADEELILISPRFNWLFFEETWSVELPWKELWSFMSSKEVMGEDIAVAASTISTPAYASAVAWQLAFIVANMQMMRAVVKYMEFEVFTVTYVLILFWKSVKNKLTGQRYMIILRFRQWM